REDKSSWWEYYRLCELSDDELIEDKSALGGLTYVGVVGETKKSLIHRYEFPPQEHVIDQARDARDPRTRESAGTIEDLDERSRTIDLKRGRTSQKPHPTALIPLDVMDNTKLVQSIMRLGGWVADRSIDEDGSYRAARDILLRRAPRL